MEIRIGDNANLTITQSDEWVVLHVNDGGGGKSTVSLNSMQAFDVAELLKGAGITAAHTQPRIKAHDTQSRIADVQCPNCKGQGEVRGPQSNMPWFECCCCKGSGVVTEREALDWPAAG